MTRRLGRVAAALLCLAGAAQVAGAMVVPAKAVAAQWLLDRAFARSVAEHRPVRPWPWADMAPAARVSVPRLGVSRIVIDTGSGQALAFGPTLLPGTGGTAVIAAHRDTHFAFLRDVRVGDMVAVEDVRDHTRRYRVTGTRVVRADGFALAPGGDGLALVTCWPFGGLTRGPWRYVVSAERM